MYGILAASGGIGVYLGIAAIIIMVLIIVSKLTKLIGAGKANAGSIVAQSNVPMNETYCGVCKDVVVTSCGAKKIEAIKYVREASRCGLAEAKSIVEGNGRIQGLPIEVAEDLIARLANIGTIAEML